MIPHFLSGILIFVKKILQTFVIFIIAIGIWELLSWRIQNLNTPHPAPYVLSGNKVSVDIDNADPKVGMRKDGVTFEPGQSALDMTRKAFPIQTTGENEQKIITSINGKKSDEKLHEVWSFTVNGQESEFGPSVYKVKDGDIIAWKLKTADSSK